MFLVLVTCVFLAPVLAEPIVQIDNGVIQGTTARTQIEKKLYDSFRGIPFAKPPVGERRFAPPEKPDDWIGVLDASKDAKSCMQLASVVNSSAFDEDCLFINVYTPSIQRQNLSVMVWIYGGGFFLGNSKYSLYAPDYFLEQDVVFVSFNYRLSIFGFYTTEDLTAPGNAGLKDQILALNWIKKNIASFGGNPEDITLFGQSAGSASISYLLQTSLTKNLFNKVIMESGHAIAPWALARNKRDSVFHTGKLLGIQTNDSKVLLEGLRTKTAQEILLASLTSEAGFMIIRNPFDGLLFAPSLEPEHEGAVVTGKSYEKLLQGDFQQVPLMLGHTNGEGLLFYEAFDIIRMYLISYTIFVNRLTPIDMNIEDSEEMAKIGVTIAEYYNIKNATTALNQDIVQFLTDNMFAKAIQKAAELHSNFVPTFFYKYTYVGNATVQYDVPGVSHSAELEYLFANKELTSQEDILHKNRLIKLWTNFAKYSHPTPVSDPLFDNLIWTEFTASNQATFILGNRLDQKQQATDVNIQFWKKLYEDYGHPPYDTY